MAALHPITNPDQFKEIPGFPGYLMGVDRTVWSFWGKGPRSGKRGGINRENLHRLIERVDKYGTSRVSLARDSASFAHTIDNLYRVVFGVSPLKEGVSYEEIPGFPGYLAGEDGTIWTLGKFANEQIGPPVELNPWLDGRSATVGLRQNGRTENRPVHQLILETFVGPCPPGMMCCRKNGDSSNNSLSEIRWDTRAAHAADLVRNGLTARGERNGFAKLSDEAVETIGVMDLSTPSKRVEIAARYDVHPNTIYRILAGMTRGVADQRAAYGLAGPKKTIADYPDLVAIWNWERNGDLTPEDCPQSLRRKLWWRCTRNPNHEWQAKASNRNHKKSCPYCLGKKTGKTVADYPRLFAEWNWEKNGSLHPQDVAHRSCKKVWWKCVTKGHEWQAEVNSRTRGNGCKYCCESRGEKYIESILVAEGLDFSREHKIPGCKFKITLRFDFAVFSGDKRIALIEYQGQQHYESIPTWGGPKVFSTVKRRDQVKRDYCQKNGIPLLAIPYWDFDRVPELLSSFLGMFLPKNNQVTLWQET